MVKPRRCPRPSAFAAPRTDNSRFPAGRCPYQSRDRGPRQVSAAPCSCAIPRAPDPACDPQLDTIAARNQPTPTHRGGRSTHAIVSHLDALYALAYLSSGDPDRAQQEVIDAFTDLCRDPPAPIICPSRLWRSLADHVHLASRAREDSSFGGPGPFRDSALPAAQREALALRLGGRRDQEAAQLLGVSLARFLRHIRAGLVAIQATQGTKVNSPDGGHPPEAASEHEPRLDQ